MLMDTQPPSQPRRTARHHIRHVQLHLFDGPAIAGYRIQHNEEQQVIVIDDLVLRCAPDEYRLLAHLMEHYGQPVSFEELLAQFRDASTGEPTLLKLARRKLTDIMSSLRLKLWPTDFTVVRVVDVGYLLLPQEKLWSLAHPDLKE